MKRRAFLKLLGIGAAATALDPAAVFKVAAEVPPAEVVPAVTPGIMAFDLLPPARFIYPVLSPMRNQMRRTRSA